MLPSPSQDMVTRAPGLGTVVGKLCGLGVNGAVPRPKTASSAGTSQGRAAKRSIRSVWPETISVSRGPTLVSGWA